nr:unnamed protein product [Digitaria exilis]
MRNLHLVTRLPQQLQLQLDGETLIASAVDAERRRAFFASSDNFIYTVQLPASSTQGQEPLQWSKIATQHSDVDEVVLEPGDCIVAMDYLMERESLLLGSSAGCLLLYNVEEKTTEVVGRLEGGVNTIASSPDGALLSVTTGLGQLLVITQDWEVLSETSLDPQATSAIPVVRSKAQFLGGEMGRKLHSSSDAKNFMGAPLDWMPSGAKVATAHDRRTEGKCPLIVFYEKNGLERSHFSIDEPAEAVIHALKWNCNSEILAALVSSEQHDVIKIWSCRNNHWYLKHELRYTKDERVKFFWDPTKPMLLICWTLGGKVIIHSSFTFYSSAYGTTERIMSHLLVTTKQDLLYIVDVSEIFLKDNELTIGIHALAQRRFKDAMDMVRRHRIDFNIIVDYCGCSAFIELAADFVKQVNNLSHITEFVCSVKNSNVSSKLYEAYISFPDQGAVPMGDANKVTSVLMAVRKALEEQIEESSSRELCVLTTLARSEPPLLEEALNRIKVTRELELLGLDDDRRKLYPSAEESLKHLLWLTDTEAVFGAALGLYDLNLAAIVALNSQKDPKEFLPFLKSLECLPPAVMRYTIDLRLGRYESALRNIVSAGNEYHKDFMKLLHANPQLFPLGLQLFHEPDKRNEILEAWGDHLSEEKCFGDAALTYQCCSSYQKSLKAYRACGDWRGVFTVAGLLELEKEEITQLAHELCDEFQALGKPGDAARVALEYCSDAERGVSYYIMAREWEEALRVAYMRSGHDLVGTVRDAASECATSLISEYQEGLLKVGKYLARYVAVRQRRLSLAAKLKSEDRFYDVEDDNISEVGTSFSEMSAYTTSPGEEMALVEHLKGMALTGSAEKELKSLLVVLIQLGKEECARQLQLAADNFEVSQRAAVKLTEDTEAAAKVKAAHCLSTRRDTQVVYVDPTTGALRYLGKHGEDAFDSEAAALNYITDGSRILSKSTTYAKAVLGYAVLGSYALLLVATQLSSTVPNLPGGGCIYTIAESQWIKIQLQNPQPQGIGEQKNIRELADLDIDGKYYFSETRDITRPFPSRMTLWEPDEEFVWNEWLSKPFKDIGLPGHCVILLQGFAECRNFGGAGQQGGLVALIARRSRLHPGTRYLARGLNACSGTGNEVLSRPSGCMLKPVPSITPVADGGSSLLSFKKKDLIWHVKDFRSCRYVSKGKGLNFEEMMKLEIKRLHLGLSAAERDRALLSIGVIPATVDPNHSVDYPYLLKLSSLADNLALLGHAVLEDRVNASIGLEKGSEHTIDFWNLSENDESCYDGACEVRVESAHDSEPLFSLLAPLGSGNYKSYWKAPGDNTSVEFSIVLGGLSDVAGVAIIVSSCGYSTSDCPIIPVEAERLRDNDLVLEQYLLPNSPGIAGFRLDFFNVIRPRVTHSPSSSELDTREFSLTRLEDGYVNQAILCMQVTIVKESGKLVVEEYRLPEVKANTPLYFDFPDLQQDVRCVIFRLLGDVTAFVDDISELDGLNFRNLPLASGLSLSNKIKLYYYADTYEMGKIGSFSAV